MDSCLRRNDIDPSINATLTTILGREAARRTKLTLDEVLRENRRLEPGLTGLKAQATDQGPRVAQSGASPYPTPPT